MKRCPECEFLYEDEQDLCDMDGAELKFTTYPLLSPQPVAKVRLKSIWGGLTIPLLVVVLIGTVLVLLYRAAPPTFSSSLGLKEKSSPATNQNTTPPASEASPQIVTAPDTPSDPVEPSPVQSARTQIKAGNRPVPPTDEKVLTALPAAHIQHEPAVPIIGTPKPATSQTSPAPASQKPAASTYAISVHPEPPPATPAPQSKPQNQEKDSKLKSLFKKAGRVLKKPF